jgi:hypothetical protein
MAAAQPSGGSPLGDAGNSTPEFCASAAAKKKDSGIGFSPHQAMIKDAVA